MAESEFRLYIRIENSYQRLFDFMAFTFASICSQSIKWQILIGTLSHPSLWSNWFLLFYDFNWIIYNFIQQINIDLHLLYPRKWAQKSIVKSSHIARYHSNDIPYKTELIQSSSGSFDLRGHDRVICIHTIFVCKHFNFLFYLSHNFQMPCPLLFKFESLDFYMDQDLPFFAMDDFPYILFI